jgi:Na+/alanine symporter
MAPQSQAMGGADWPEEKTPLFLPLPGNLQGRLVKKEKKDFKKLLKMEAVSCALCSVAASGLGGIIGITCGAFYGPRGALFGLFLGALIGFILGILTTVLTGGALVYHYFKSDA